MGCEVVGVERRCMHCGRTSIAECLKLVVEVTVAARGQYDRRASRQSQRQLDADLAAAAEDHFEVGVLLNHGRKYYPAASVYLGTLIAWKWILGSSPAGCDSRCTREMGGETWQGIRPIRVAQSRAR